MSGLGPNKAFAAGTSATLAGALVTVALRIFWPDAPADIAAALTTLVAAIIGAVVTWLTPAGNNLPVAVVPATPPSPPGTTADDLNRAELARLRGEPL